MNSNTRGNNPEQIDLLVLFADMGKGLMRWWGIFVIMISILASVSYFGARLTYSPYFTAYSTFTVNTPSSVSYNSQGQKSNVTKQIGEVFPFILTSDALRSLVREDLGYDEANPMPATISASVIEDTNLVTLSVSSRDSEAAYDVLESVLRNYPAISEKAIGEVELKVMDESGIPTEPANPPDFRKKALVGVGIGAAVSLVWLVLYSLSKRTIHSENDLKKYFNLTFLGSIPSAVFKKRKKRRTNTVTVDSSGISSSFVEAVRTVRHRVEREAEESPEKIRSIIVTSALRGEGKTTVAVNLAIALANRGHSVLLVDGDLRSPSVGPAMELAPQQFGMVDLLEGRCAAEDVLITYKKKETLTIIPGGKPLADPTALWGSSLSAELIREFRKQYDYVIMDAPPSAVVSDASLIARYMDGCLLVVRQDYARIDMLQDGLEMFSGTDCSMIGCVLNRAEAGFGRYGYGYGRYGYGYGRYGYGYGDYGYGGEAGSASSRSGEVEEDAEKASGQEDNNS